MTQFSLAACRIPNTTLPSLRDGLSVVHPLPNMYPVPPPGSSLVPISSNAASTRRARPAGKLGSALPALARPGGTITLAYGVIRSELLDGSDGYDDSSPALFEVRPPAEEASGGGGGNHAAIAGNEGATVEAVHEAAQKEGEVGQGGDGEKWLARVWRRPSARVQMVEQLDE